ncbi:MAG: trigger factor [Candidatus Levyibacteriota bacterium]
MKSVLAKTQDGTITLTITIPVAQIKKAREEELQRVTNDATLPGFRKGKAPKEIVEKNVDKAKLQEDILRRLLPTAYTEAVTEHKLKPVINPKIHVTKLEDDKDWEFTATTCETPEVTLKNYKDAVKKITAKSKIVVPGKENPGPSMDDIIKTVLENVTVVIPQILLDGEVERLLAQLLDEIKSLGLSLDQYLGSTHKTIENLKKEQEVRASQDITFEFALAKIAEEEKITVDQKEIDEALGKAKDDAERKNLESNVYLLASILRQQKTLDYLKNL